MNKPGPKGPRKDSVASLIRKLITAGLSDKVIASRVKKKHPKYKIANAVGWYRWQLRTKEMT